MENKDYKRLTVWNEKLQRPCMTADFNEETVDIVARHVDRLYELENAIENGMLVFLPCKVGDKFWCVDDIYPKGYEGEVGYFQVHKKEVFIVDVFGLVFPLNCLYFTWEKAKKALKEE